MYYIPKIRTDRVCVVSSSAMCVWSLTSVWNNSFNFNFTVKSHCMYSHDSASTCVHVRLNVTLLYYLMSLFLQSWSTSTVCTDRAQTHTNTPFAFSFTEVCACVCALVKSRCYDRPCQSWVRIRDLLCLCAWRVETVGLTHWPLDPQTTLHCWTISSCVATFHNLASLLEGCEFILDFMRVYRAGFTVERGLHDWKCAAPPVCFTQKLRVSFWFVVIYSGFERLRKLAADLYSCVKETSPLLVL